MGFFEDVHEVTCLIPRGRVTSYGAIATYLGAKGSSRMVGWALSKVANEGNIPAHRVLNRNGMLTGKMHFPTPNAMENLLVQEGVPIKDDKVVGLEKYFWDPNVELNTELS